MKYFVIFLTVFTRVFAGYSNIVVHPEVWRPDSYIYPVDIMADITNYFGLGVFQEHNFFNENNIAFSPYGLTGMLIALYEGVDGYSRDQISRALGLPHDINVVRIGFRDIHRRMRSYFLPEEGFLAGLSFNHDNVTFREEYVQILRYYGFDYEAPKYPLHYPPATHQDPTTSPTPETTTMEQKTTTMSPPETTTTMESKTTTRKPDVTITIITETTTTASGSTTATMIPETTTITMEPETTTTMTTTTTVPTSTTTMTPTTTTTTSPTTTITMAPETTTTTVAPKTTTTMAPETTTTTPVPTSTTTMTPTTTTTMIPTTTAAMADETITTTESTTTMSTTMPPVTTTVTPITTTSTTKGPTTTMPTTEGSTTIISTTEGSTTIMSTTEGSTTTMSTTAGSTTTMTTERTTTTPLDVTTVTTPVSTTTMTPRESTTTDASPTTTNIPSTTLTNPTDDDDDEIATTPVSTTTMTSRERTTTDAGSTTTNMPTTTLANDPSTTDDDIITTTMYPTTTGEKVTTKRSNGVRFNDFKQKTTPPNSINGINFTDFSTISNEIVNKSTSRSKNDNSSEEAKQKRSLYEYMPPYESQGYYYEPLHSRNPSIEKGGLQFQNAFLAGGRSKVTNTTYMTYDTILDFANLPYLNAMAIKLPLDTMEYYLLIILPNADNGVNDLIRNMHMIESPSLRQIHGYLRPTRVHAWVPSFKLDGNVILTHDLQELGIRDVFDPRYDDFHMMTPQRNVYVRNIEQKITVNIRKYMEPNLVKRYIHNHSPPVEFAATHPFVYFVMDSSLHVSLMMGKIVNPKGVPIFWPRGGGQNHLQPGLERGRLTSPLS